VIDELKKVKKSANTFKGLSLGKLGAELAIPIALMGFVIPKIVFASSAKKVDEQKQKDAQIKQTDKFLFTKEIPFTSGFAAGLANLSTVNKMAITDGGYAGGRLVVARDRNEFIDTAVKMSGMMFLNFVAPKYIIEPALNKVAEKSIGINPSLDLKMLADKDFLEQVKAGEFKLPTSSQYGDLLKFVDDNPKSLFVKYSGVKMLDNVRDPRQFVDLKALAKYRDELVTFTKNAGTASFFKKARGVKIFNILANVGLSSFLLAYALPKVQYAFRKLVTGSDLEPGIAGEFKKKGVSA